MSGDVHVRFSESLGVKFPRATHPSLYTSLLKPAPHPVTPASASSKPRSKSSDASSAATESFPARRIAPGCSRSARNLTTTLPM